MFTGCYVVNPATGGQIPVFLADYVLMGYGTGAIMGVPAHDQRDLEFAGRFGLDIRPVLGAAGGYLVRQVRAAGLSIPDGSALPSPGSEQTGAAGPPVLPAARLAVLPAALLGGAVPDRV